VPGEVSAVSTFGGVPFAHSDIAGISTIEEAQYFGVLSAEQALEQI